MIASLIVIKKNPLENSYYFVYILLRSLFSFLFSTARLAYIWHEYLKYLIVFLINFE